MRWPWAALIAFAAALGGEAAAGPLDEAACKGVKAEREGLVAKGLEADIAKGPEWGRANLAPERLGEIARFIELTEQLTFRCGEIAVVRPDGKPLLKKAEPPPRPPGAAVAADPASAPADGSAAKPAKKKKKAAKPVDALTPGTEPPAGAAKAP